MDNQELKERVSELEENVKVLTEERDAARKECERLHHQVKVLTHRPYTDATRMDMDLERNLRNTEERGLNSKATGVVFMVSSKNTLHFYDLCSAGCMQLCIVDTTKEEGG